MKNNSRRFFMTAVAVVPLHSIFSVQARASDLPRLEETNPTAVALEYVHQTPIDEQRCTGCQLFTGAADAEWGPCAIFPGVSVSGNGWCKSWVPKAS